MESVFNNEPIRANPKKLFDPFRPARLPTGDRSWQGKPAVTIKPSLEEFKAKGIDFAESDRGPVVLTSRKREAANPGKKVKVPHDSSPRQPQQQRNDCVSFPLADHVRSFLETRARAQHAPLGLEVEFVVARLRYRHDAGADGE
jgi:hypothetical protein